MPFAIPMILRQPKNHYDDCYFCMTKISGFSKKTKSKINYPDCPSAMKPVTNDKDNIPTVPSTTISNNSSSEDSTSDMEVVESDSPYVPKQDSSPHLLSQAELNDLVCDLELTKEKAELLGSRIQD